MDLRGRLLPLGHSLTSVGKLVKPRPVTRQYVRDVVLGRRNRSEMVVTALESVLGAEATQKFMEGLPSKRTANNHPMEEPPAQG